MNVLCITHSNRSIREQIKEAYLSFIQRINMSTNLVILGRPPGRALFNVKSRTLRVLTMVFCWWELKIVTMATPLIFFLNCFLYIEQDAGTNTNSKTRYGLRKNLLRGTHIPPPHLEFAKLQVYGVQVSFCSYSFIKAYRGVIVGVALIFIGIACPSFFLIFPRKVSDQKYPKENYILEHALAFYWKGNE